MKIFKLARVVLKLGLVEVLYVIYFKKFKRKTRAIGPSDQANFQNLNNFFRPVPASLCSAELKAEVGAYSEGRFRYFFNRWYDLGCPPDFLLNPIGGEDIKWIYDPSRFHWMLSLARAGNPKLINDYLEQWVRLNPPYVGPNWTCGQEESYRVLHILVAAKLLGQLEHPNTSLVEFVSWHIEIIKQNIGYAEAQRNNHVITEALGLYLGSLFLIKCGRPKFIREAQKGRKILERNCKRLIGEDGSFPLYSTNYHRSVLQLFSLFLFLKDDVNATEFPAYINSRIEQFFQFLYELTEPDSGRVPNLGPNDGSYPFKLNNHDYRDFRPSLSVFWALFRGEQLYSDFTPEDFASLELATLKPSTRKLHSFRNFSKFGLIKWESSSYKYFQRYPNFQFRPIQDDCFHLDLWVKGRNVLIDSGTFSYNRPAEETEYFNSSRAHNMASNRGMELERIRQFLFLEWPVALIMDDSLEKQSFSYSLRGNSFSRQVLPGSDRLKIIDQIQSTEPVTLVHFHFDPEEEPVIQGLELVSKSLRMSFSSEQFTSLEILQNPSSTFYGEAFKTPTLRLVLTGKTIQLVTEIRFKI